MSAFTIICSCVLPFLSSFFLTFFLLTFFLNKNFRKFINYSLISKYNYLEMKNTSRYIPVCTDCHKMEMKFKKTETFTVDMSVKTFYVFECPRCKGTKILGKRGYNEYQKEKNKREYDKKQKKEYISLLQLQPMGHDKCSNYGNISTSIRKSLKTQLEQQKTEVSEDGKTNSSI